MFQTAQLLAGCDPDVEGALFRQDPFIAVRSVEKVLAAKRITVISDPLSVRRSKLFTVHTTARRTSHTIRRPTAWSRKRLSVDEVNPICQHSVLQQRSNQLQRRYGESGSDEWSLCDDNIRREVLGSTVDDMTQRLDRFL